MKAGKELTKAIVMAVSCMMTIATAIAATFNGTIDTDFGNAANWDQYPVSGDSIVINDGKTAVVDGADSAQTALLASLAGAMIGEGAVLRVLNYPDGGIFQLAAGKLSLTGTGAFEFVCDSGDDTVRHGSLSIYSNNSAFEGSFKFVNANVQVRSLDALGSGCPIDFDVPAIRVGSYAPFSYFTGGVYNHPLTIRNTRSWFALGSEGVAVTNTGPLAVAAGCTFPVRLNGLTYFAQAGDVTVGSQYLLLNGHVGLTGNGKMSFEGTAYVSAAANSDYIDYGKREIEATVSDDKYRPLQINRGHWRLLEDDALKNVPFYFGGNNDSCEVWLDLNGHHTWLGYSSSGWTDDRKLVARKGVKHITSSGNPATATISAAVNGYDGVSESSFAFGRYIDTTVDGYATLKASFPASGITGITWYTGFLCPEGSSSTSSGDIVAGAGTIRMTAKSKYANLGKVEVSGISGNFWVIGTPTLGGHTALVMSRPSTDTTRANGWVCIDADQTLTVATASDAGTPIAAGAYTASDLPNVLSSTGSGTLVVTGTPTITAEDVLDENLLLDGVGFLNSTVLTISAEELAKIPRKRDGEHLRYKIATNVSAMPRLSSAFSSVSGWKVTLDDGDLYLNSNESGFAVFVR